MITNHSEEFWKLVPSFRLCIYFPPCNSIKSYCIDEECDLQS